MGFKMPGAGTKVVPGTKISPGYFGATLTKDPALLLMLTLV